MKCANPIYIVYEGEKKKRYSDGIIVYVRCPTNQRKKREKKKDGVIIAFLDINNNTCNK